MTKKEELIKKYAELSYKLGKLPSIREAGRFGLSKDAVSWNFETHSKFKIEVLNKHPDLVKFETPPKLVVEDIETYRLELEKKNNKKVNKALISDVSTLDYIESFAEKVFKGKISSTKLNKSSESVNRVHTLVLSDLHIGSDIKSEETGSEDYGVVEESRRLASIVKAAGEYKPQYRKTTKLKVLLLGDIIENQLHDPRTGAVLAEQVTRAIHLLIQAVSHLASLYSVVEVECATGNHGRITSRHKDRAVHQKWDSFETIIYYAVKSAFNNVKHVSFNIPKTPIAHYNVFGYKIGYTHGDTVLNPGNPGTSVNVKSLEAQVNKLNAALPDKQEYSVIIFGHTHCGHVVYLNNGTVLLGNGSLPPPDPFAVSIGITEALNRGQWIFESVEGHPVGDLRYLTTGKEYDKNKELDKIIKPWESL